MQGWTAIICIWNNMVPISGPLTFVGLGDQNIFPKLLQED